MQVFQPFHSWDSTIEVMDTPRLVRMCQSLKFVFDLTYIFPWQVQRDGGWDTPNVTEIVNPRNRSWRYTPGFYDPVARLWKNHWQSARQFHNRIAVALRDRPGAPELNVIPARPFENLFAIEPRLEEHHYDMFKGLLFRKDPEHYASFRPFRNLRFNLDDLVPRSFVRPPLPGCSPEVVESLRAAVSAPSCNAVLTPSRFSPDVETIVYNDSAAGFRRYEAAYNPFAQLYQTSSADSSPYYRWAEQ